MKFDTIYKHELGYLEEGKLSSLALAGLLAAGSPQMAQGASNARNQPHGIHQPASRASDSLILKSTADLTSKFEGYSDSVYKDSKGIPTIGYGTNLKEPQNLLILQKLGYDPKQLLTGRQKIKETDAKTVLERGLEQALSDARQFLPNFDQQPLKVKQVIVDMSYNMGLSKISHFNGLRSALLNNNYKLAKQHMIGSHWFKQVGKRGKQLVNMMDEVNKQEI